MGKGKRKPKPKWNKEEIWELLDSNPRAVAKAIVMLYRAQTPVERNEMQTSEHNNVGFDKVDARTGSKLAKAIIQQGGIQDWSYHSHSNQLELARAIAKKYWRQLAAEANRNEAKKVVAQMELEVENAIQQSLHDNNGETGYDCQVDYNKQYTLL